MAGDEEPVDGETTRPGITADVNLDRFLEGSMDLLAILDFDTVPIAISRSWERLLGWPLEELLRTRFIDLVHPDDLEFVSGELGSLLEGVSTNPSDVRLRGRDGTYRWVQASASSVLGRQRIYLTATDIQARKHLEDALRRQIGLEELVASIGASLIRAVGTDVEQVVRESLGRLAGALGADRAHFLRGGRRPDDLTYVEWRHPDYAIEPFTPDPDPDVQDWWREVIRSERLLVVEDVESLQDEAPHVASSLRSHGVKSVVVAPLPRQRRFWGFLALVALRDQARFSSEATHMLRVAGEAFLAALAQDDTAIALLDARRELEHRNDALERSNEALERFAYAAAHDLRAPLTKVELALSLLDPVEGPPPDQVRIAQSSATRMRRLIDDLLAFSEVSRVTGKGEPVELDNVLDEVLADVVGNPGSSPRDEDVEVRRQPLPVVMGHRALLVQLLQNLLVNAVKFRHPDRPVRIEIHAVGAAEGGVTLSVADNGIGIPPEERHSVFDAFKRLHASDRYTGSGIGLATCAKVADVHDGRIWADDGIDGGTAVKVWLPPTRLVRS